MFFLRLIFIKEVLIELQNLNPSKSAPSYNPPVKYLKLASRVIAAISTKLFNISISTSTFPNSLKTSEINPLHKKEDRSSCRNYKLISLIPTESKILKKMYLQIIILLL